MSSPARYTRSPNGTNIDSQDTFKNNETRAMFSPTCVSMKSLLPSKKSNTDIVQTTYVVSSKSLFAKPNKRESKKMFDEMLVFQNLFREDDTSNGEKVQDDSVVLPVEKFPLHLPTKTNGGDDDSKMVMKRQRISTTTVADLPKNLDLPSFEQETSVRAARSRLAPIPSSSRKEVIHFKKVERGSLFDPDELNEVSSSTTPFRDNLLSSRNSSLLMLPEIGF